MTISSSCKAVPLRQALLSFEQIHPGVLPVSRATVYRMIERGQGPANVRKIGARLFTSVGDLKAWADALGTDTASTAQK